MKKITKALLIGIGAAIGIGATVGITKATNNRYLDDFDDFDDFDDDDDPFDEDYDRLVKDTEEE